MGTIGLTFLGILLFLTSVFMMLLILVQRGKGGGLTGALGGMGGQSAFGSKAGDVFTRITVITAIIWITLCMITIAAYNPPPRDSLNAQRNEGGVIVSTDEDDGETGGMTGDDSANSEDAEDDTSAEDVDQQIDELVEDDIEAPADPDSNGEEAATDSNEDIDDSDTPTGESDETGSEESSDDN